MQTQALPSGKAVQAVTAQVGGLIVPADFKWTEAAKWLDCFVRSSNGACCAVTAEAAFREPGFLTFTDNWLFTGDLTGVATAGFLDETGALHSVLYVCEETVTVAFLTHTFKLILRTQVPFALPAIRDRMSSAQVAALMLFKTVMDFAELQVDVPVSFDALQYCKNARRLLRNTPVKKAARDEQDAPAEQPAAKRQHVAAAPVLEMPALVQQVLETANVAEPAIVLAEAKSASPPDVPVEAEPIAETVTTTPPDVPIDVAPIAENVLTAPPDVPVDVEPIAENATITPPDVITQTVLTAPPDVPVDVEPIAENATLPDVITQTVLTAPPDVPVDVEPIAENVTITPPDVITQTVLTAPFPLSSRVALLRETVAFACRFSADMMWQLVQLFCKDGVCATTLLPIVHPDSVTSVVDLPPELSLHSRTAVLELCLWLLSANEVSVDKFRTLLHVLCCVAKEAATQPSTH